jgi:purine-binding chemotaxis protein CheW
MSDIQGTDKEARQQFITFVSGEQEYGANIMTIREIRGWTETTPLPHAPSYVRGVINLRGVVLPVVDLKARLGRGITPANPKHVIIVIDAGSRTLGLLVDAVSDILTARASEIQPTPELARDAQSDFVDGIVILDQRMVTLLSLEKLATSLAGEATAEAA